MFGQQRSQSGPAGLSINTGSANSLFSPGNTSQGPQSGGLFGSSKPASLFGTSTATTSAPLTDMFGTTTTTSVPAGNIFGASTTTSKSAGNLLGASTANPGVGLFGSLNTGNQPQQQQQQGGGLFGSLNLSNQPQQQGGGLFGQAGGLFGASSLNNQGQQQQQQPPQQQGGGLFGNHSTQQQQGAGLFGSLNTQQALPQLGGSLFGASGQTQNQNQNQQQQQGGNRSTLFMPTQGQNIQQPSFLAQSSNMAQSQQPQRSMFASSIGQYSQQQQTIPGVRVDLTNLRPTTRFNDCHEDLQKIIEHVDGFILTQMHFAEECEQSMPKIKSAFLYMPDDVDFCTKKLDTMQQALETDAGAIDGNKRLLKKDAADARLSFKAIQNLRMPQHFHHASLWNAPMITQGVSPIMQEGHSEEGGSSDLVSYFSKHAEDMSKTLDTFKRNIAEVESYLKGVESNTVQQVQRLQFTRGRDGGQRSADDQVRELAAVLREFESGILGVASKVGGVREQVQDVMLGGGAGRSRRRGLY